ncbi:hypothetical protein WA556_005443 [Blastocystis sp. ATCC 50177/Nand II]
MNRVFARSEVRNQTSPRKKFSAIKRLSGDVNCDDVDSNQLLQKKLKLSKSSYYSAVNAMKEGREVGRNGRPPYLRDVEKVEFWDWVECKSHEGNCATMKEMREYVTDIVRAKRPAVLHNRRLVSRGYIRKILGEGGLLLDKCCNSYTTKKLLSIDEASEFFALVGKVLKEYGITPDLVFNFDESWISPQDKAPRCKVAHARGDIPTKKQGNPREHYTLVGCISGAGLALPEYYIIPPRKRLAPILEKIHLDNNYIAQSAKGWMSNESLARWMRDLLIPAVNQIRGNNKDRHALIIADAHASRYDKAVERALRSENIHMVILPAKTTALLQPLDVGIYSPYKTHLKEYCKSNGIEAVLDASRNAFSDAFTRSNILQAWKRTTLLSDDHSSILAQLPEKNEERRNCRKSRLTGVKLF